jgi:Predicted hydrolases of the HAD superfamily
MISNSELRQRLKNIKLVVTDVDGTLTNENNAIGETTKALVPKLRERGIMFSFATQRIHSSIVDYAKELGLELPIMTINGALIRDLKGNDISKSVIPQKKVIKASESCFEIFCTHSRCVIMMK